jgi:hypothetical protein
MRKSLQNDFVVYGRTTLLRAPSLRQGFGMADVAIDRFTGQALDKKIEVVNE